VSNKLKASERLHYGIAHLSITSVLDGPDLDHNQLGVLLFGECFKILRWKNADWIYVQSEELMLEGWVPAAQILLLNEKEFIKLAVNYSFCLDTFGFVSNGNLNIHITFGARLPGYDGLSFRMGKEKYHFNGQSARPHEINNPRDLLIKLAKKFINTPYHPFGRTVLGINNARFIQLLFQPLGLNLPDLPEEQLLWGEVVDFVNFSKPGDIAFFENTKGKVVHCGIIISANEVLHMDEFIRIDFFDQTGLYRKTRHKYLYKLRIIKNLIT
jgi:gamma-D-glutamyl-L-lysine dipeptidyl-peptidase